MTVRRDVIQLIKENIGYIVNPALTNSTTLSDTGMNDNNRLELLLALEDEFGVYLGSIDDLTYGMTIEELIKYMWMNTRFNGSCPTMVKRMRG